MVHRALSHGLVLYAPSMHHIHHRVEMWKLIPVVTRYWLLTPGWSTSCITHANIVANISRSVNTFWTFAAHSLDDNHTQPHSQSHIAAVTITHSFSDNHTQPYSQPHTALVTITHSLGDNHTQPHSHWLHRCRSCTEIITSTSHSTWNCRPLNFVIHIFLALTSKKETESLP